MTRLSFALLVLILMVLSGFLGFKTQQSLEADSVSEVNANRETKTALTPGNIIGSKRPDFSLRDLQDQERHVSEWDGKILAVNFWATWCPPCLEEIPEFIQLQNEFGAQGLQFLGIALQTAEEVQPFYDEQGMNYPTLVGQEDVIRIAKRFGNDLGALPYTVVISPSGIIHYVKRGPLSAEKAREVIKQLL